MKMDFEMNIGESLDFNFEVISSHKEASLPVGYTEVISDGTTGFSGTAELIENIIQEG
jgi:hypothetical protein